MGGKKRAWAILLGLAAVGTAIWGLRRRAKAKGPAASVSLAILDAATDKPVPHGSPVTVVEGGSYIARCTITNQSMANGTPAAALLRLVALFSGPEGSGVFDPMGTPIDYNFGPSETQSWDFPFTVPMGTAGLSGFQVGCNVIAVETGETVAGAAEWLTIEAVAPVVTYAAAVTLEVI